MKTKFLTFIIGLFLILSYSANAQRGGHGGGRVGGSHYYGQRGGSCGRSYAPRIIEHSYGTNRNPVFRPYYGPIYANSYGYGYPRRIWNNGYYGYNNYGVWMWFPGYWIIL